jgi:hypothetical protein
MESPTSLLAATAHHASPRPHVPRPRRPRRRFAVTIAAAFALLTTASAADADTRSLSLITDGVFGTDPAIPAKLIRVSDDGSRVFFTTPEVMASTDTDSSVDAYMRSGPAPPVHLTDNPLAPDAPVDTFLSTISADGTHAYFSSKENLVATDTDVDAVDAYERTPTGALVHLSDSRMGADFNDVTAYVQAVTPDGRHVFFDTYEPLVASDTDASSDTYDYGPAGLIQVTDGPGPDAAGFSATFKRASDDGSRVYFETREKLLPADTDAAADVYLRTAAGVTLLTDTPTGPDAEQEARLLDVTPDGASVVFETREPLAATDTDTTLDVYRRAASGALTHISDNPTRPDNAVAAYYGGRSADGATVVFGTAEPMAASDTDTASDAYLRRPDGTLVHVSDGPGTDQNVDASTHAISLDGTRVVFQTSEPLAPTDTDSTADSYLRPAAGALVHLTDDPTGADEASDSAVLATSPDATRVVFATKERFAPSDTDTAYDIYERLPDGKLVHLSDDPTGPDANVDAGFERMSADARRVYFTTDESLSTADTDTVADAYVATLLPDAVARPRPRPQTGDTLAPQLTRLQALPRRSLVRFRLSEPAEVRLAVRRRGARRRVLTIPADAGGNRVRVRLRVRGRYRIAAVATDAAGNRSAPRRIGLGVRPSK